MAEIVRLPAFESPTAGGAITSAAARLFAEEGRRLADSIEKISLENEARAKAPALAAAYATGLSKLSEGDMSGFELLTKAESESVGNPFLMQMTRQATSEGARMANSYIQSQRQTTSADAILDRQTEMQRSQLDRQSLDDWRSQVNKIDTEYQETYKKWEMGEAGRRRQASLEKIPYTPTQPPERPAYPEKPVPTSRAFGGSPPPTQIRNVDGMGLPEGRGSFETGLMPNDTSSPSATTAAMPGMLGAMPETVGSKGGANARQMAATAEGAMTNRIVAGDEIVNEANAAQGPVQTSISGPTKEPPARQSEPLVNEIEQKGVPEKPYTSKDSIVVPFGDMAWVLKNPGKKMSVSETVPTPDTGGSKTYTIKNDDGTQDDVTAATQHMQTIITQDPEFVAWQNKQAREGKQVSMTPTGDPKKDPWIAKSNGVPMGMDNPDTDPAKVRAQPQVARPIIPSVGQAWDEAQKIIGPMVNNGRAIPVAPKAQEKPKVSGEQLTAARQKTVDNLRSMKDVSDEELTRQNEAIKAVGGQPITREELTKKPEKKVSQEDKQVQEIIASLKIKTPELDKQIENANAATKDWSEKFDAVKEGLKNLFSKAGPTSQIPARIEGYKQDIAGLEAEISKRASSAKTGLDKSVIEGKIKFLLKLKKDLADLESTLEARKKS